MRQLGALAVLLGTVSAPLWVARPIPPAEAPTKERIEADLRLRVELRGPKTVPAGTRPWPSVTLVNTSRNVAHRVVKPGDGSEVGWREPYVYWTATLDRGDGRPVPVPDSDYVRCGLFDWGWPKDTVLLGARGELPLDFEPLLEFQQAGRVRLRAHYAYHGGGGPRSRSRVPPDRIGQLAGVPAFEIISDPVEFDVVRPLDVRVQVKRALTAGVAVRLSDLIEVTLVNQSREPVECASPTLHADARLGLEIEGEFGGWRPALPEQGSTYGVRRVLKPGEAVPLLGRGDFANGLDGTWTYPQAGTVRLRAAYTTTTWKPGADIKSDWVEVRVTK
jgi:hypothetical protein